MRNRTQRLCFIHRNRNFRNVTFFVYLLQMYSTPGAGYVRRRSGEAFLQECIAPTVKYGGGSIMIWGAMTAHGVCEAHVCEGRMNGQRYIEMLEEVLEPSIVKFFDIDAGDYFFQQDNAPCHKARPVIAWFAENGIQLLDWPPQSPDLSPIENLWHILKEEVRKHQHTSKEALKRAVFQEWASLSPELCFRLVASMPKRIKAVIQAKGGSTKY